MCGKRHLIFAGPKVGKSITCAIVMAIDIVAAGGTVYVLDRENGGDEYARRLEMVLNARGADEGLRDLVARNYRYHACDQLKLEWGRDPDYVQAFDGATLVIFDSSRKFLTSLGLKESENDDFDVFAVALVDPLFGAGVATMILDNVGHSTGREGQERARGASSKADVVDVVYGLKRPKEFSVDRAGCVEMECKFSRVGELTGTWDLELGGGRYGAWSHRGGVEARNRFHDTCVAVLEGKSPLGRDRLVQAVRDRGESGTTETWHDCLGEFVQDVISPIIHNSAGFSLDTLSPSNRQGETGGVRQALSPLRRGTGGQACLRRQTGGAILPEAIVVRRARKRLLARSSGCV